MTHDFSDKQPSRAIDSVRDGCFYKFSMKRTQYAQNIGAEIARKQKTMTVRATHEKNSDIPCGNDAAHQHGSLRYACR